MRELGRRIANVPRSLWRTHRAVVIGAITLFTVIGLIGLAAVVSPALLERFGLGTAQRSVPPPPRLALGPLPTDAPVPSKPGLAATLAKVTNSSALGKLTGVVVDPATGETLWSRNPEIATTPGSTNKLLTMAAVLLTLDPAARISTQVVAGDAPNSVVLVGGGDPTLSVLPKGEKTVYPEPARLDALAEAVRTAHPEPIESVLVDVSLFTGEGLAEGWDPTDVPDGYVTPIQSLILDGGRSKPAEHDPPRTATPALDAGKELARRLGANPDEVRVGIARPGAAVLGEVSSPTIRDLVESTLRISDNVLAESLARQVALARGETPSFAGAGRAVRDALREAGFDITGARIIDGSGLSPNNKIPARLLGEIVSVASGPGHDPRSAKLRPLLTGLPVAGGDGTLDDRFAIGEESAPGRGFVRAKTGTLTGVSSLAGLVTDADGRLLVFALMSTGTSPAESRPRLDAIAAALRECGCR